MGLGVDVPYMVKGGESRGLKPELLKGTTADVYYNVLLEMAALIPKLFAFWDNDLLNPEGKSYGKYKSPEGEYLALQRSIELDGEWHKGVTSLTPSMVLDMTGSLTSGGRPIPDPRSDKWIQEESGSGKHVQEQTRKRPPHPCHQCGLVVQDVTKHVLNQCDRLSDQGRYR